VSLFFYRVAAQARRSEPEKTLVVAARPLPPGAPIAAAAVKTVRVPEKLFPHGGFSRVEEVVGRPVVSSIQPDEPVVEARISPRGSGFGVAPMIPPGMRAMAVRVNDVAGVAGFVLPGSRVDVLVTGRPPGSDDTVTTPVLEDVAVLSAGQTVEADSHSQSMSVPVVTLLVTPAQAVSLTLGESEGKIQLVLRNSGDRETAPTRGRELRALAPRRSGWLSPLEGIWRRRRQCWPRFPGACGSEIRAPAAADRRRVSAAPLRPPHDRRRRPPAP